MSTTAQPIPGSVQRDLSKTARQPSPVGSQCNKELTHKEVAEYAYSLWLARGCPEGCGEEDWFLAEKRLRHEV
jgi:Protein of unknown function (DUF2934)